MRHGQTVDHVLQPTEDILIPLMLPDGFATFAQETMNAAFKVLQSLPFYCRGAKLKFYSQDHDTSEEAESLLKLVERLPDSTDGPNQDVLVFWKITPLTMWQQVDRRLDEWVLSGLSLLTTCSLLFPSRVNEILWTFQRCGCNRVDREGLRSGTVCMQISRRSVRLERDDELKAFHDWAFRKCVPLPSLSRLYAYTPRPDTPSP